MDEKFKVPENPKPGDYYKDEDGREWISWYLFERKSFITGDILPWYDEEGNEHICNDAEDLWEIVKNNLKIK